MKTFYIPTAISIGLLMAYIATAVCHSNITEFSKDLTNSDQKDYTAIRKERLVYTLIGFGISLLVVILYLVYSKNPILYHKYSNASVMFLAIPMVVYLLLPKRKYMLQSTSLTNQDVQDWFKIYQCMSRAMLYGFFVSFLIILSIMFVIDNVKNKT